jgi:hypothetical protein
MLPLLPHFAAVRLLHGPSPLLRVHIGLQETWYRQEQGLELERWTFRLVENGTN